MGMKFHGDKTRRAAVATRGGQSLGACDGHTHGACNTRLSGAALAVHLPRAAVRRCRRRTGDVARGAARCLADAVAARSAGRRLARPNSTRTGRPPHAATGGPPSVAARGRGAG